MMHDCSRPSNVTLFNVIWMVEKFISATQSLLSKGDASVQRFQFSYHLHSSLVFAEALNLNFWGKRKNDEPPLERWRTLIFSVRYVMLLDLDRSLINCRKNGRLLIFQRLVKLHKYYPKSSTGNVSCFAQCRPKMESLHCFQTISLQEGGLLSSKPIRVVVFIKFSVYHVTGRSEGL